MKVPPIEGHENLSDPQEVESRAAELAGHLSGFRPSTVLTWQTPWNVVVAHVVARELGAASVRCFDDDGLIEVDGPLGDDGPVAIVVALDRAEHLRAMLALTEQQDREVVVVGALGVLAPEVVEELERLRIPLVVGGAGRPTDG